MSRGERVVVSAVNTETNTEHGSQADEIIEHIPVSSAEEQLSSENARTNKRRYRLFLKVLQKVNMLFLVMFVCYFAWTISVNDGRVVGDKPNITESAHNTSSSIQADDISNFSGTRQIPFYSSSDKDRQDKRYHPNIIVPSHRKQTKKRRKKEKHKKRNRKLRNKLKSYNNLDDYSNLTIKSKRRNRKKPCIDCKIRKRKGRNRQSGRNGNRVSALTLRKILERVASETLSGARSGDGMIRDLYETSPNMATSGEQTDVSWNYEHHWVNIAANEDVYDDQDLYSTDNTDDDYVSPWSSWSACSAKCGAGQRERMRRCGTACKEVESMVCLNTACKEDTGEKSDENDKAIEEFYKWENKDFVPPLKMPEPEFLDPTLDSCSNWVECSKNYTNEFIMNSTLPGCPCEYPLRQVSSKDVWDNNLNRTVMWVDASSHRELVYKPGAGACIRSKLAPGAITLAVQQCCYDNSLSLVTRGKSAGTPNLISPEISKELHYKVDLLPWVICKGDWTRYNEVIPPNNDFECPQNPSDKVIREQELDVKNY